MPGPATTFGALDWTVVAVYFAIVLALGFACARRSRGTDEMLLAGRSMPTWAVAISLLATMQSAATFVGGPQQAYAGNLTYLLSNIAPLLAAIIVAVLFIPAFYKHGVTSIYEVLGRTFGRGAQVGASAAFLGGRVMASGARLYIVALPFSLIVFGDLQTGSMIASILIIAAVASAYTALGGIRAVIWTDVLQATVYVGTVVVALFVLVCLFPSGPIETLGAIAASEHADKLKLIDLSFDWQTPYTLPAILTGLTLFMVAALGADQDLAQRMLTCRGPRRGAMSVILGNVIAWPVIALFMLVGLLLFVRYQQPGIVGMDGGPLAVTDGRGVFLEFILSEIPAGLRGLMLAGLFAAAMSSTDSALSAMASSTVADFYRPWRARRGRGPAEHIVSRIAIAGWAVCLAAFACICVSWHAGSGKTLIDFALGVMTYAYSGLVAVFLAALLTKRGNEATAVAALIAGVVMTIILNQTSLAFTWTMLIASATAFMVCVAGPRASVATNAESVVGVRRA